MKGLFLAALAMTFGACAQKRPQGWEPKKPKIYMGIYNLDVQERNPDFRVGDKIQLTAHKVGKSDKLELCQNGTSSGIGVETSCTQNIVGDKIHKGWWSLEFPLERRQVGSWENWLVVNGNESNKVFYRVVP